MILEPLPQMAVIFILLPLWTFYYSAKRYGIIRKDNIHIDEIILTEKDKMRLFSNIRYSFYIGGLLAFIAEYVFIHSHSNGDLISAFIKSGSLILIGISMSFIQKIKNESKKEVYMNIILSLSIPIITFQYLEYASVTIWVLPILIIMNSLVLNKKILLISATIVAIVTQRLLWILKPKILVQVDHYDYIGRIFILAITFVVGVRINNIYLGKIKENAYQINFQKMNSELSFDFVNLNQENFDYKVDSFLSKISSFFNVDRSYLYLIDLKENSITYVHEWYNIGIQSKVSSISEISLTAFPWWMKEIKYNKLVCIDDISRMPEEAALESKLLVQQNIKSLVSVTVEGNQDIQGFIALHSINNFKTWSNEDIKLLHTLSNLMAHGLMKIKSEREIEFMAYYDDLTKLPNRFLFSEKVNQALSEDRENKHPIYVIFIDLDDFKSVNDTMGHSSGDLLLTKIGKGLKAQLNTKDLVARFGGDEFMIMINPRDKHLDIKKIATDLMGLFSKPFNINGQNFYITASAGIASSSFDGKDSETLIKNADTAMYEAKYKGKNQYAFCTDAIKDRVKMDMILSNDLYKAIERKEFTIHYQPHIDLHTGKISGVEALLRWVHPDKGMISPGIFIPLAEKNNLINTIGKWVLKTACIQNKRWQDMGIPPIKMGVNLSAIQFVNPRITDQVEEILQETGLNPKYLELEITEGIAIKEVNYAVKVLNKFKNIGVSIALDDFGTEYSSLSRLKVLPIDRIKIDMQFIEGIEKNEKDRAIIKVIINLAKSLGLNVLAEGVETVPQLDFLNQEMCDYIQGYYYYKPMPSKDIEKILKAKDKCDSMIYTEAIIYNI